MRKNARADLPSDLQLDVLLVLYEGARSSGELVESVTDLRRREVALATFYRQLQKALDRGWVGVSEAEGREQPGPGRPERWYRISPAGETVLRLEMQRLRHRMARARACGLAEEQAP